VMVEEILVDAENITLERLERYFAQRRERKEQGNKSTQDWFLEMFCQLMQSLDDEDAERSPQPEDVQQALRLISNRLDALDRKMPKPKEAMPRAMQFAKERCQTMAKYLWHKHPEMTQVEMAQHEAIYNLSITDGKRYEIDTIKDWIAEVDPRPAEKKRGRPRKAKK
jgi:hypothetical protein